MPNESHDAPHSGLRRVRERGTRRNVYVSGEDERIWSAAEEFARKRRVSLSSVVAVALARYLAQPPPD